MRHIGPATFALLALINTTPAAAQLTELQPGVRVRIQAPGVVAGRFEGTVLMRSADTIVVGAPNVSPIRVAVARISALEISRGTSRADGAIAGMKWGAPIMAATGATLGIAAVSNDNYCNSCKKTSAANAVGVTAVFALAGVVYGAGIGALIGREHWDAFDLASRTSLEVGRGRIGLTVGF